MTILGAQIPFFALGTPLLEVIWRTWWRLVTFVLFCLATTLSSMVRQKSLFCSNYSSIAVGVLTTIGDAMCMACAGAAWSCDVPGVTIAVQSISAGVRNMANVSYLYSTTTVCFSGKLPRL